MKFEIHHGNAYERLPMILESLHLKKTVAIVTDPPYDYNSSGGGKFRKQRFASNEITKTKLDKGFDPEIFFHDRISSVLTFMHNDQLFTDGALIAEQFERFAILDMIKANPSPMANKHYVADKEIYIHYWNKGAHPLGKFNDLRRFMIVSRETRNHDHPTIKPLMIMRKMVRNANADVIIDPFMGSGTTGVACLIEGKYFIGIEKEEKYFNIAHTRITDFANKLDIKQGS